MILIRSFFRFLIQIFILPGMFGMLCFLYVLDTREFEALMSKMGLGKALYMFYAILFAFLWWIGVGIVIWLVL